MRRTLAILLSLCVVPTLAADVTIYWTVQVDLNVLSTSLASRGYVWVADAMGTQYNETADFHHAIVNSDASYSARSTTPYSKLIQSSHPAYAGTCYTARLAVYPTGDDSSHFAQPQQVCLYGPPAPPSDPDVDDPGGCGYCDSPIIVALDDVYRLTSFADGVQFDLRNNGQPSQIAWTEADTENAFLALDRNGNGRIDNGSELFGNFTPLRSGSRAQNGFEALAELDDDNNGVIDANDSSWAALVLWVDRNHDGRSDLDELQPAQSSPITGFETYYRLAGRKDRWGNRFRYQSHVRLGLGERRPYYDIFLATTP